MHRIHLLFYPFGNFYDTPGREENFTFFLNCLPTHRKHRNGKSKIAPSEGFFARAYFVLKSWPTHCPTSARRRGCGCKLHDQTPSAIFQRNHLIGKKGKFPQTYAIKKGRTILTLGGYSSVDLPL